jgi:trimeric autotransporter adhesin
MSHNHKKARTSQDYDGEEDNDAVVSTSASASATVLPPSVHSVPMSAASIGSAAGIAGIAGIDGRAIPVSASAESPSVSRYTTLAPAPAPSPSTATTAAAGVTSASSSSAAAKPKPPNGVGYGFGSPAGMLNPAHQARSSGSAGSILGNVRETLSNAWSGAGGGSATKPPTASIPAFLPGSGSATQSGAERAEADGVHHKATSTPASGLAPVAAASSSAASRARYISSASAWNASAIKREPQAQSQSHSQSHHSPATTVSAGPKSSQGQQHSNGISYIPPSFDDEVIEVDDSD